MKFTCLAKTVYNTVTAIISNARLTHDIQLIVISLKNTTLTKVLYILSHKKYRIPAFR
jgi:hypothetical protein